MAPRFMRPTLLYTDGAEFFREHMPGMNEAQLRKLARAKDALTEDCFPKQRTVCGVLDTPDVPHLLWFKYTIDCDVIKRWLPRTTIINQVECSAGVIALDTWPECLASRDVLHYLDSNTSLGSLTKGSSSTEAATPLVGAYWSRVNRLKNIHVVRKGGDHVQFSNGPTKSMNPYLMSSALSRWSLLSKDLDVVVCQLKSLLSLA